MDDLAAHQAELLAVVQHRVQVLDPGGVHLRWRWKSFQGDAHHHHHHHHHYLLTGPSRTIHFRSSVVAVAMSLQQKLDTEGDFEPLTDII